MINARLAGLRASERTAVRAVGLKALAGAQIMLDLIDRLVRDQPDVARVDDDDEQSTRSLVGVGQWMFMLPASLGAVDDHSHLRGIAGTLRLLDADDLYRLAATGELVVNSLVLVLITLEDLAARNYLCWIVAPISTALSLLRDRLQIRRDSLAQHAVGASLAVQQAGPALAMAAVGLALVSTPLGSVLVSEGVHVKVVAVAQSAEPENSLSRAPGTLSADGTSEPGSLPSAVHVAPAVPSQAPKVDGRIRRDERHIRVDRWVSAWTPTGSVEHEHETRWRCSPDSIVSGTVCAGYDALPEGPWAG